MLDVVRNISDRWPSIIPSIYLYYYSRFVTARSFVHRAPTTMFGVSMDSLWPTDQRLIASFWIPASEGPEGFWREIQIFALLQQYGCQVYMLTWHHVMSVMLTWCHVIWYANMTSCLRDITWCHVLSLIGSFKFPLNNFLGLWSIHNIYNVPL